jgi:uncharacterized membrane protein YgdD (TMEM256/DUF423 family)
MLTRLLTAAAAVFLACGVALAAYAAHAGVPNLVTVSQFLMMQGAAVLGGLAAADRPGSRRLCALSLLAVSIGTAVFCGDLALRGLDYGRLFPMAAPAGGFAMIGGWAAFAAAALFRKG